MATSGDFTLAIDKRQPWMPGQCRGVVAMR